MVEYICVGLTNAATKVLDTNTLRSYATANSLQFGERQSNGTDFVCVGLSGNATQDEGHTAFLTDYATLRSFPTETCTDCC